MIANKSNKAIVLIATIATLAVISVILMFFAQSSIFERQLTSNNNLERQAELVATASIEWAASYIPKLAMGADEKTKKSNGSYEIESKAYSSVADFYQFQVKKKNFDGYDPHCPVEEHYSAGGTDNYTGKPSFYYENKEENGLPYEYSYRQDFDINMVSLPTVHNINSKVKNDAPETEEIKKKRRWTVHSTLKCVDANAFWNINSPITNDEHDTNADYRNMVTTLVSVVLGKNEAIIDQWVEERKKGEFADLGDFRERMSSVKGMEQKDLDKICRYITVDSWGNKKSFKYGKDYNHIAQDTDELWEKRYPININVASKEILTVVFQGITTKTGGISINKNTAEDLAERIVKDRKKYQNGVPFKTWNDVENYLYNKANLSKNVAEAIFAVIYPGMLPNKKSPNRAQYRKFDKMDVEIGTTECCLFSPGVFYCEAIGRVIEYAKKPYTVLAHSKVSVNMKLWEPYIVNSQADFEKQRTTEAETDAWTGIEGGITPPKKYKEENLVVGYLQEIQEEKKENKECRYWKWSGSTSKDEETEKEMRSDGLYFNKDGYLEDNYGILDLSSSNDWNEWDNTGFDLWIKPSYDNGDDQDAEVKLDDNNNNTLPIAMKVEKANNYSNYYILTRCAYDKGVDYNDGMERLENQTYLTLSRTLCLKSGSGKDCKERTTKPDYRIFYNMPIRSEVKRELRNVGGSVYESLRQHIEEHCLNGCKHAVPLEEGSFYTAFSNNVYDRIMEGRKREFRHKQKDDECVVLPFKMYAMINKGSHGFDLKPTEGKLKVHLPNEATSEWNKVELLEISSPFSKGGPSMFSVKGKKENSNTYYDIYFYMAVFDTDNDKNCSREDGISKNRILPSELQDGMLYYGYVNRKPGETKEAREIAWFPGEKNTDETSAHPIQLKYKYSRTECRIPIKLYKGRWYHIHARWEANKILIKEFDVSYKKMKSEEQEDSSNTIPGDRTKIHTEIGRIRKNFIGGPGRLWVKNEKQTSGDSFDYPAENEINKIYYYCPNCVIYYSNYRNTSDNNMKRWRYGSPGKTESIYNGNFDFEYMVKGFKAPKYFYYGTVAWTQFFPENKKNGDARENGAVFNINGNNKFYSWGEEKKSSKDLENPNSIFLKKYDDIPKMPFKFDLHDNNNEGDASASHLETTIVDRVVLYMIVQPQPIHWSYNTYKDKNLYH